MNHALLYSVLYGPGDQDAPRRAKFTDRQDAEKFAAGMAVGYASVSLVSKTQTLRVWRHGDVVK